MLGVLPVQLLADYANDNITATPKGVLSSSKKELAATGNQDFGYFAGGSPGSITTVNRLQYSSDTSNMVTKGPLNTGRRIFAATGNSDSGYFMGGPGLSSVERLTFANDTVALTVKGPLSSNYSGFGATGTQNFGYTGGSVPAQSKVDRIDYSNDTATASPKGPLSAGKWNLAQVHIRVVLKIKELLAQYQLAWVPSTDHWLIMDMFFVPIHLEL